MPTIINPAPSLLAAIIAYLQQAMSGSLNVSAANPAVWRSYSPDVPYPYAVVSLGGDESYDFQSNDPEQAGYYTTVIANGLATVSFVATTEAQTLALARECVRHCADTVASLIAADGDTLELRPQSSHDNPFSDSGVESPQVFRRTVVIRYTQQFPI